MTPGSIADVVSKCAMVLICTVLKMTRSFTAELGPPQLFPYITKTRLDAKLNPGKMEILRISTKALLTKFLNSPRELMTSLLNPQPVFPTSVLFLTPSFPLNPILGH